MENGKYITDHGSTVEISGESSGRSSVEFDWFEEPDACCDCQVEPYPEDGYLIWYCDDCSGGSAELTKVE